MILSVHQPQYIPWLGYFDKIAKSDSFVFLDQVQYKPREYQNRNKIRIKDGWMWLSVPVETKGKFRQGINEVLIDNGFPWQRQHLGALRASYGKAEFFKEYFPFFEKVYSKNWKWLFELNIYIIEFILQALAINKPIHYASKLGLTQASTELIIEICAKLQADTYLSGMGGKVYLEEDKLRRANIKLIYQDFSHPVYHQHFAKSETDFIPYLSTLDLLFNAGPRAKEVLKIS